MLVRAVAGTAPTPEAPARDVPAHDEAARYGPAVTRSAGLALTACQLEHPERISSVTAECGVLSVPENPARPAGRRIGLSVARVPATNKHKSADPLFVLAGGPGMAATTFYT